MTDNLQNLIIATPVIGVLLFFLNYFMKVYEYEKKENKKRDDQIELQGKQDSKILEGLTHHIKDSTKKQEESNKKHDETTIKIDQIIRKLDT